ncbi:hypothetical protein MtrunA17_Chr1g0161171 [Medicago truncatula]|nr:hypothetical protein MtrunA17_Chr1g0161171 [Medicago truncatula]
MYLMSTEKAANLGERKDVKPTMWSTIRSVRSVTRVGTGHFNVRMSGLLIVAVDHRLPRDQIILLVRVPAHRLNQRKKKSQKKKKQTKKKSKGKSRRYST